MCNYLTNVNFLHKFVNIFNIYKMKKYISVNMAMIRDVWSLTQEDVSDLLNCTRSQISSYEGGRLEVPAEIIFRLEDLTGIVGRRLFYEELKRSLIYYKPLLKESERISMMEENQAVYETEKLTILERLERIEKELFKG